MKRYKKVQIDYLGTGDFTAFLRLFNTQLLTELKGRGLLSETLYIKGLHRFGTGT